MEFKIEVPVKELRENTSLFLGLPMYGGKCDVNFATSLANLSALFSSYGIPLRIYTLSNESLVQRARNYIVDEFLRSDCTHFMFIDADIGFKPEYVALMLAMQYQYPEKYDVLCGPYPKKTISWEKIKLAVDKGFADENPEVLGRFVGDYVFNPKHGTKQIPLAEPSEVLEGGTGFMMITRRTFEKYAEAFPELSYKPDHVRTQHFDGSREIMAFFDCIIEPETKRYLSEDYFFCYNVQRIGLKVWLCPWMELSHAGSYLFGGSLADIAALGTSPTADPNLLGKKVVNGNIKQSTKSGKPKPKKKR